MEGNLVFTLSLLFTSRGSFGFRNAVFVRTPASPGPVCASAVMLECADPISMSHVHRGKDFCLRLQPRRLEKAPVQHVCHGWHVYADVLLGLTDWLVAGSNQPDNNKVRIGVSVLRILLIHFLHTANSTQTDLTGSGKGRITLPCSLTVRFHCRKGRGSCLLKLR